MARNGPAESELEACQRCVDLFVHTPCNYLQVAVSVQDDVFTQLWMMVTDRGCVEPTDNYQAWTEELFEQPVQWKLDGDTLTLKNSHATIELKES